MWLDQIRQPAYLGQDLGMKFTRLAASVVFPQMISIKAYFKN